jgi:hypothetical protein
MCQTIHLCCYKNSPEVTSWAERFCLRFLFSLRHLEDLPHELGTEVGHEVAGLGGRG